MLVSILVMTRMANFHIDMSLTVYKPHWIFCNLIQQPYNKFFIEAIWEKCSLSVVVILEDVVVLLNCITLYYMNSNILSNHILIVNVSHTHTTTNNYNFMRYKSTVLQPTVKPTKSLHSWINCHYLNKMNYWLHKVYLINC